MHFLEVTLPGLAENLALDEALLLEAEAGRGAEVLRLWEWRDHAVVLGAGCRLADDVDETGCRRDSVPILRRASGGGTVLLGPGCLIFSLVLARDRAPDLAEITPSHRFILEMIRQALCDLCPDIGYAGTSDLAIKGRKFSGNSQQRKRDFILHHGTLLYDFEIAKVSRYLKLPERQPDYRQGRRHGDFLTNLPIPASDLKTRLRTAWQANAVSPELPTAVMQQLLAEKYASEDWIRRR